LILRAWIIDAFAMRRKVSVKGREKTEQVIV
jgi:hypothetical protein